MTLYADYLREHGVTEILEVDSGFATYRYINDGRTVYIVDIYVVPECRKSGIAAALADTIALEAKERGCTEMLGSVVPSSRGTANSIRVLLSYGMTLSSVQDGHVIFRKDI